MRKAIIIFLSFFFFPFSVMASGVIVSPVNNDVISSLSTDFMFQTDGGSGYWAIFDTNGQYFCGTTLAGYTTPDYFSMNGLNTVCGSTRSIVDGAFHIVANDRSITGVSESYTEYVSDSFQDICLSVGGSFYCVSEIPTATTSTSTILTAIESISFQLAILMVLAFFAFISYLYSLLFKQSTK